MAMSIDEIYKAVGAEPPKNEAPSPISAEKMRNVLQPKKKLFQLKSFQIALIIFGTFFVVFFVALLSGGGQKTSMAASDREKQMQEALAKSELERRQEQRRAALGNSNTPPQVAPITPIGNEKVGNKKAPPVASVVRVRVPPSPSEGRVYYPQQVRQTYSSPSQVQYQPRIAYRSESAPQVRSFTPTYQNNESAMDQWKRLSGLGSSGQGGDVLPSNQSNGFTSTPYSAAPQIASEIVPQGASPNQGARSSSLPTGSTAIARLQQDITWTPGSTPRVPVLLELVSDFKDRSGNFVMKKGALIDGKIANANGACYFDIEISKIGSESMPDGAVSATSIQASYKVRGGPSLGDRLLSGLSNVGAGLVGRAQNSRDFATSAGGTVAASVMSGNGSYGSPQSVVCKVEAGKEVKLLVNTDAN
jgi:hypothetical protein